MKTSVKQVTVAAVPRLAHVVVPRRRGRLSAESHSKGWFVTLIGAQPGVVTSTRSCHRNQAAG